MVTEDISTSSVIFILLTVVAFFWVMLTASTVQKRARKHFKDLREQIGKVEEETLIEREDLTIIKNSLKEKADYDYLNQRMDSLISLIKKKA